MNKTTCNEKYNEKIIKRKAGLLGIFLGILFGASFIAYSVTSFIASDSFKIKNTRGTVFTINLNGAVEGIEVVPGSEQSVNTSITNQGTEKMYVFVRFDSGTTPSGSPIYSFTTSNWSNVDQLLFVYGNAGDPTPLLPGETASMSGTLRVEATGADFVNMTDDDFEITVTGCAVGGPEIEGTGADLYAKYLGLGGI